MTKGKRMCYYCRIAYFGNQKTWHTNARNRVGAAKVTKAATYKLKRY